MLYTNTVAVEMMIVPLNPGLRWSLDITRARYRFTFTFHPPLAPVREDKPEAQIPRPRQLLCTGREDRRRSQPKLSPKTSQKEAFQVGEAHVQVLVANIRTLLERVQSEESLRHDAVLNMVEAERRRGADRDAGRDALRGAADRARPGPGPSEQLAFVQGLLEEERTRREEAERQLQACQADSVVNKRYSASADIVQAQTKV